MYLLPNKIEQYQTSNPEVCSDKINATVGVDWFVGINDINDGAVYHDTK